jgi:hypothetical protein
MVAKFFSRIGHAPILASDRIRADGVTFSAPNAPISHGQNCSLSASWTERGAADLVQRAEGRPLFLGFRGINLW